MDVEEKLEASLASVRIKYDVDFQVAEAHKALHNQWDKIRRELILNIIIVLYLYLPFNFNVVNNNLFETSLLFILQFSTHELKIFSTGENDALDVEVKEMMGKLDKLRNSLYDEFRPSIKMLEDLTICDGVPDNHQFPLVATKKVTQIRPSNSILAPDNQPVILEEIERDSVKVAADLPPPGPLVKTLPEVDTIVLVMKHALIPWLKGKVRQ